MTKYSETQVREAINRAADEVISEAGMDGGAVDAINLVVNAALVFLDKPAGDLLDAVASYGDEIIDVEDIEIDEDETEEEAKARTKLGVILNWINPYN
jgi:hypothetical protein